MPVAVILPVKPESKEAYRNTVRNTHGIAIYMSCLSLGMFLAAFSAHLNAETPIGKKTTWLWGECR